MPENRFQYTQEYKNWFSELKKRIKTARQTAVQAVNRELVLLYWQIGNEILVRQEQAGWGAKVVNQLSADLKTAFPDMQGFSPRNLKYMRAFAAAWQDFEIVQEVLAQLPWYHHLTLLDKVSGREERLAYARLAVENGWSRNVMVHHIELGAVNRIGKAQNNFSNFLPPAESELAIESLKDPYKFDFIAFSEKMQEKDLKKALLEKITEFLVELGTGFAYAGREVVLDVGGDEFRIDLLFYHLKLHCYVVIELKTGKFKPEHLGQLSFYMTAVDRQLKSEVDAPTIGLLLCKNKNKIVAEYALQDVRKPIGISEYELSRKLPENIQSQLPSVEELEHGLADNE
ncbi:MAG: DUF1016 family protein [Lentisphaeria bacterium]|nr:DUF1016 family protein [Lentisphaeria bacterium]